MQLAVLPAAGWPAVLVAVVPAACVLAPLPAGSSAVALRLPPPTRLSPPARCLRVPRGRPAPRHPAAAMASSPAITAAAATQVNVVLLGFGNVGQAFATMLLSKHAELLASHAVAIRVVGISTGAHLSHCRPCCRRRRAATLSKLMNSLYKDCRSQERIISQTPAFSSSVIGPENDMLRSYRPAGTHGCAFNPAGLDLAACLAACAAEGGWQLPAGDGPVHRHGTRSNFARFLSIVCVWWCQHDRWHALLSPMLRSQQAQTGSGGVSVISQAIGSTEELLERTEAFQLCQREGAEPGSSVTAVRRGPCYIPAHRALSPCVTLHCTPINEMRARVRLLHAA